MSEDLNVFQRWHTDGQQIHEKVFNITNQEKKKNTQWDIIVNNLEIVKSIERIRASLVVQRLDSELLMQGAWVRALVREPDPTYHN